MNSLKRKCINCNLYLDQAESDLLESPMSVIDKDANFRDIGFSGVLPNYAMISYYSLFVIVSPLSFWKSDVDGLQLIHSMLGFNW